MLILSRKTDEEIYINGTIKIRIISVSDNQVRLGISAPPDVEILRGELYEKVKEVVVEASLQSKDAAPAISGYKVNRIEKKGE